MCRWILLCLFCLAAGGHAAEPTHVRGELISSVSQVAPGDSLEVIFRQEIDPGWHTYWINPGDSGAPPDIKWQPQQGVSVGEFRYPYPERIAYGPLMNYGYHDEVLLPFTVTVDESVSAAAITLSGSGRVLVCEEICIPQAISVSLSIPVGEVTVGPVEQALFETAASRIPTAISVPASYQSTGDELLLTIGLPGVDGHRIEQVDYFPYTADVIDNAAAQPFAMTDNGLRLSLVAGYAFEPGVSDLSGVIVIHEGEGIISSFSFDQEQGGPATGAVEKAPLNLVTAMLFALLGGLILNLMPCVFPVLSIKILSLVKSASGESAVIRRHGWAYTLGVVGSFVVIALVLVGLRAGGEAIGWGFQLQSPVFVSLLAYLFVLIGLNLLGFFEVGTSLMQLGNAGHRQGRYSGSVMTGVLATIVAAPCTAPFMGAAVGYALLQSGMTGIVVFASLGLGMAIPYLILSYSPRLLARLPRPGPWMETFRQALAFPMLASAIWLLWVLGVQAGATAMMQVLAGALLIAFATWLWQKTRGRLAGAGIAIVLVGAALVVAFNQQAVTRPGAVGDSASLAEGGARPYSRAALDAAVAKGPVFVNFTAAWCITCKVNEMNALEVASVKAAFEQKGITYLKGDWTNEDPSITDALQAYGRSGVPLYLLYGKGDTKATVLPQILTPAIVLNALNEKLGKNEKKWRAKD